MKTLFVTANSKLEVKKSEILKLSKKLPEKIAICYSSQYKTQAEQIKKILSKLHKITEFLQVLGCSRSKISAQAILLVSDGKFHAISLARETGIPVYIYNRGKLEKISENELNKLKQSKKASYVRFLNAKKLGILISTKPGQQKIKETLKLKQKYKDKEISIFLCNNIDPNQFENFPEIESWINTACPRLDMNDSQIVNMSDLNLRN